MFNAHHLQHNYHHTEGYYCKVYLNKNNIIYSNPMTIHIVGCPEIILWATDFSFTLSASALPVTPDVR